MANLGDLKLNEASVEASQTSAEASVEASVEASTESKIVIPDNPKVLELEAALVEAEIAKDNAKLEVNPDDMETIFKLVEADKNIASLNMQIETAKLEAKREYASAGIGTLLAQFGLDSVAILEYARYTPENSETVYTLKATINSSELGEAIHNLLAAHGIAESKLRYEHYADNKVMVAFGDSLTVNTKTTSNGSNGSGNYTDGSKVLTPKELAQLVPDSTKTRCQGYIKASAWSKVVDSAIKAGELVGWNRVAS